MTQLGLIDSLWTVGPADSHKALSTPRYIPWLKRVNQPQNRDDTRAVGEDNVLASQDVVAAICFMQCSNMAHAVAIGRFSLRAGTEISGPTPVCQGPMMHIICIETWRAN